MSGETSNNDSSPVKSALITGITGQDGSYLAEFLLSKGYHVYGIMRRSSSFNTGRIQHLYEDRYTHKQAELVKGSNVASQIDKMIMSKGRFKTFYGDMTDSVCLVNIINKIQPDEIYNLAAQSHVKVSFEMSEYTANVDAIGVLRILDAIRNCNIKKKIKFYQASTSEMYGKVQEIPQKETTPFYPRSPYGVAKLYAYWIVLNYREAYNIYGVNGILFNHESPRRGETFVTRKITRAVAKIHLGQQEQVALGNLDARRDWGHARDYVEAMWLMMQQDEPDDYVVATGEEHSVREFIVEAFRLIDEEIEWEGEGVNEVGRDKNSKKIRITVSPQFYRPTEVDFLLGDPTKAKEKLGWTSKTPFKDLVKEMVDEDIKLMKRDPTA